jgi:hypothetical protein
LSNRLSRLTIALIACFLLALAPQVASAEDVVLFNGKDLTGWKHAGPGSFEVKDGQLQTEAGMGLLWNTMEMPEKFKLALEFKTSRKEDNSGVFVRFPDPGNDPWVAVKEGYEIQICEGNEKQFTGSVYNLKQRTDDNAIKPVGEWNQMEIDLDGQKMTVRLNGKTINEYTGQKTTARGYVGLQNHDPKSHVSFRNIVVSKIKSAATTTAAALPAQPVDKSRKPGLVGKYYKDKSTYPDDKSGQPFLVRVDDRLNFKRTKGQFFKTKLSTNFAAVWNGYLRVDKPAEYTFALRSDDGSKLYVGDTLVIDNTKPADVMKDKTGSAKLVAGDYSVRIEYFNAGGPGGIQLGLKNAEGKTPAIAEARFFHDEAQEKVEWDQVAWNKARWSYREWSQKYGEAWDKMDYGPFLSHTVELSDTNAALKGITIHLGKNDEAAITFDTDLLRYAGGWTGGFLELKGVVFDGAHGVNPAPDGEMMFTAPQLPGAASGFANEKLSKDPRPKPYGPLPHEWAKYKGLFLNGDRVTLHYTVGETDVLDSPWAQSVGDQVVITRTIKLGASDQPLTMLVDKPDEDHGMVVMTSDDVKVESAAGNRYLVFPARKEATTYRVAFAHSSAVKPADLIKIVAEKDDIDALVKAGAPRWTKEIVTKGEVTKATTKPYVLDTITVPENNPYHSWMRFGGLDFFSDGRAAVSTWSGDVWVVSGIDDKLEKLTWKRYATGLFQSLGLKIVNDEVYVLGRDQITRLKDTNNDGEADSYECFNNDCQVSKSFHEFSFDLQTDPEGNFYYVKAGPVRPGGRGWQEITDHNGCMLKVSKDGSKFEVFAVGLRAPNGMSVGPHGEITTGDNEGTWTPACRISMVHKGMMVGVPDLAHMDPPPTTYDKPICWLPHGDVDNSSGGQVWVTSDKWGPFENRLLHTSYGTCSLFLVMYETVDGQIQGGVAKFPNLDFITGICRPRFNKTDGQLYVAGLRGWQTTAAKDAGLQRVRYTGATVNMPTEMHVKSDGIEITFTSPVDASMAADASSYAVEQWNYKWSSDYGSAEYSVTDPKEKAHDPVEVQKATLSADKKTVFLKLDEVVPVMQMKIQMKIKGADGTPMDYSIYNTINKVPKGAAKSTTTAAAPGAAASAQK